MLVAGGDGAAAKIACRLLDSGVSMAILPLGTANNLARTLGFNSSPEEIIARLKGGKKRVFDVGVARGPWGRRYFLEGTGAGLLADYIRAAGKEDKESKNGSKEQKMTRHVSLLRRLLHDYSALKCKIDIDGEDVSDRYILWEAMNIRSVGPALYFAPRAATKDGKLDFVCVRETDRSLLMDYLDARLAGKKHKFPLPIRRFRQLRIIWERSTLHFDDELWPRKKHEPKGSRKIEITVKPSALIILQPAATVSV